MDILLNVIFWPVLIVLGVMGWVMFFLWIVDSGYREDRFKKMVYFHGGNILWFILYMVIRMLTDDTF